MSDRDEQGGLGLETGPSDVNGLSDVNGQSEG